jgi:hypothetical protein
MIARRTCAPSLLARLIRLPHLDIAGCIIDQLRAKSRPEAEKAFNPQGRDRYRSQSEQKKIPCLGPWPHREFLAFLGVGAGKSVAARGSSDDAVRSELHEAGGSAGLSSEAPFRSGEIGRSCYCTADHELAPEDYNQDHTEI